MQPQGEARMTSSSQVLGAHNNNKTRVSPALLKSIATIPMIDLRCPHRSKHLELQVLQCLGGPSR